MGNAFVSMGEDIAVKSLRLSVVWHDMGVRLSVVWHDMGTVIISSRITSQQGKLLHAKK